VFPQTSRTSSNWRQTIEDLDQEEKELDLRLRASEIAATELQYSHGYDGVVLLLLLLSTMSVTNLLFPVS